MREYENLPDPELDVEGFNQYLRDNNVVVKENEHFIIIENSYIENQLVAFAKVSVKDASDYQNYPFENQLQALKDYLGIFADYPQCHNYINAILDRSVKKRFHIHIKL